MQPGTLDALPGSQNQFVWCTFGIDRSPVPEVGDLIGYVFHDVLISGADESKKCQSPAILAMQTVWRRTDGAISRGPFLNTSEFRP